jgi:hypothetical protein
LSIPKRKACTLEQTKVQRLFFLFLFLLRHKRTKSIAENEPEQGERRRAPGGGGHPSPGGQEKDKMHRFEHYQFSQYSPSQDELAAYMAV